MMSKNPFADFRLECTEALKEAVKAVVPEIKFESCSLNTPSNPQFGQLASSICFELAKKLHRKPADLSSEISQAIQTKKYGLIQKVESSGAFINFYVNFTRFAALTLESIRHFTSAYGFVKSNFSQEIIVEHTSVNPLHPIHIGQARNPMIGDAISRILRLRGHKVSTHYYIDDVGRQSSVIAYGYFKLGKPKPDEKIDHYIGKIYTLTSCIVELNRLQKQLKQAEMQESDEDVVEINKGIAEWTSIAAELQDKHPRLFNELQKQISTDDDPEEEINKLNRAYEAGERAAKNLVREVSDMCLDGFRETQSRVQVFYDSWDWESDLVWSGQVSRVLKQLEGTGFVFKEGGVLEFDAEKVVQVMNLKEKLGLSDQHEVTPLTLVRADGTTLYTTRDIAYTLWKFDRAERIVNVIGMEQSLAQLQLKIALYALGYVEEAENFVHFAYNLVTLPGYKMSSRRGHYVTFDEVLDEAVERAYQEVSKRSPQLTEDEKLEIARFVGIGAVRYALVDVDPSKPVVFTWDRVLNFETNSAPYVQYTHARACSILRKANSNPQNTSFELLTEKIEQELLLLLASFPDKFIDAAEYLKPNMIADFSNSLADKFNTFYNALPVIKAGSQELTDARLVLTDAVRIVLSNALNLVGIIAPERM